MHQITFKSLKVRKTIANIASKYLQITHRKLDDHIALTCLQITQPLLIRTYHLHVLEYNISNFDY